MRLALCAAYLDADLWGDRLSAVVPEVRADDFSHHTELIRQLGDYDGAVVALDGPAGLEAVRAIREAEPFKPLLWISDEAGFARFGYQYRVTHFLLKTAEDDELAGALRHIEEVAV